MLFMKGLRMKFEKKSSKLLSITKSKSKMYEFNLDEEHHIKLVEPPSNLLLMTIGILGDFCHEDIAKERNIEIYEARKKELINVSRYFDSLIGSRLQSNDDYYLRLLGAASYYLSDMPGSCAVLAKTLASYRCSLTDRGVEFILEYVLNIHEQPRLAIVSKFDFRYNSVMELIPLLDFSLFIRIVQYLQEHFYPKNVTASNTEVENKKFETLTDEVTSAFLTYGSDREILLSQILSSVIKKRINDSTKNLLPLYSGLSWSNWTQVSQKTTFVKELWPAQRLLGKAGVFKGKSAVVQLPTSAGKTKSAELIIRSSFLSERSSIAVIIAPFRSLCREISESLSLSFKDEDILVNQLNDVPQVDEFDIEFFSQIFDNFDAGKASRSIVVTTPEKLVYLLRQKPELAEAVSLVIYDEGHQFDTGARGVTYELLLTSLKQKLRPNTQHVLISAVLTNATSIGNWLYAGIGEVVNGAGCLSTERSVAFSSWRHGLGQFHYVEPLEPNSEEFYVPRVLESLPIPMLAGERIQKQFPDKSDKMSIAAYLGLKLSQLGPVAVFCGTKKTVASICKSIVFVLERLPELPVPRSVSDQSEIDKIANLARIHLGAANPLVKAIIKGVLPHSAGIPNGLRISIEYAMEHGFGKCVVCTSTLAQGVNLPIKYLIVSGVFQGQNRISTRDFHNLLGRAGRSGKHTEGSIIFTDTELFDDRNSSKNWQWKQMRNLLDPSQSEKCSSSLLAIVQPFQNDSLMVDPIKFIESPDKYEKLVRKANEKNSGIHDHLLEQMYKRRSYLRSLESYILANSDKKDSIASDILIDLYTQTFAYSIATEDERKKLAHAFQIVAARVSTIDSKKRSCFGKALLGLDQLLIIEEWLHQNVERLSEAANNFVLLESLWTLLKELLANNSLGKIIGDGFDLIIAKLWCSGTSYFEILKQANQANVKFKAGSQERKITIENIIEICDSSLGYDAMLIAGACADLTETIFGNAELAAKIRQLQMSLKIGLDDMFDIWLYSHGLSDRAIAKDISQVIQRIDIPLIELDSSVFRNYKGPISSKLSQYPSVFYNSIYG